MASSSSQRGAAANTDHGHHPVPIQIVPSNLSIRRIKFMHLSKPCRLLARRGRVITFLGLSLSSLVMTMRWGKM
ncbi:hypothetical protein BDR06DRAFT_957383 [Suillus hirtellus]|nr:hypothetical protein BDR06DRAFT_957383 [Suillus hirtellus]